MTVTSLNQELKDAIIQLAGDRRVYDSRQRWLEGAARKAGISYRTAKSIFYEELQNPRASLVDSVRAALRKEQVKNERIGAENNQAVGELLARISDIERDLRDAREALSRVHADRFGARSH